MYEKRLISILALTFVFVYLDMAGINYLIPFIQPELNLTNTEIGILSSGYWLTFGLSSYLGGFISDRMNTHKGVLLSIMIPFSMASVFSGFAHSFRMLLLARVIMGLLSGPFLPIVQTFVMRESNPKRTGLNMGIVHNTGISLVSIVVPYAFVALATHYSWRTGFFIPAFPSLICVVLIARLVRKPAEFSGGGSLALSQGVEHTTYELIRVVFSSRNFILCMMIACVNLAYSVTVQGFMPLYLIRDRFFAPQEMGLLMGVLGVSGAALGILLPALSDRVGRKPILLGTSLLAAVIPLAGLLTHSIPVLATAMFVGWGAVAIGPLIWAIIPSESVPPHAMTMAMGIILAISTLLGGVLSPYLAGLFADRWGLSATMVLSFAYSIIHAALALSTTETSPRLKKRETTR